MSPTPPNTPDAFPAELRTETASALADDWTDDEGRDLFVDLTQVVAGNYTPPAPDLLHRSDGHALFYSGMVNALFGDPESGKTWVALAAVVSVLRSGGRAVFVDLDHNGRETIANRLRAFGVAPQVIADRSRFRFTEPEDSTDLLAVVDRCRRGFRPDLAVVDSIGELLPLLSLNSNSPDDYTAAHRAVLTALARGGAAVVAIDHLPKNEENAKRGATGTAAKRRAVDGAYLRVSADTDRQFTPGHGGSCTLAVNKDRPGGLRAHCPVGTGDREPLAARFEMFDDGYGNLTFTLHAPGNGERNPETAPDPANVARLLEEPNVLDMTVNDAQGILQVKRQRAADALREAKAKANRAPGTTVVAPTVPGAVPDSSQPGGTGPDAGGSLAITAVPPGSRQFPEPGTGDGSPVPTPRGAVPGTARSAPTAARTPRSAMTARRRPPTSSLSSTPSTLLGVRRREPPHRHQLRAAVRRRRRRGRAPG